LKSQTNPWKELKKEKYMVNSLKNIYFSVVGYTAAKIYIIFEIFLILNLNNFAKIKFPAE
jgi:hypothetical protein